MPASFTSFNTQYARNNFDAMRPAPIFLDANQAVGQCQQIHVSTNCYYGYHEPKTSTTVYQVENDCEMMEEVPAGEPTLPHHNARKRSASDDDCPQAKRLREEVQRKRNSEPETNKITRLDRTPEDKTKDLMESLFRSPDNQTEDLMESLFWNTHGGNMFHLLQCL